jgi:hypothetical protein
MARRIARKRRWPTHFGHVTWRALCEEAGLTQRRTSHTTTSVLQTALCDEEHGASAEAGQPLIDC